MRIACTGEFVFALAWLVLVLSVGAISLLYLLLRRGAASHVASPFFLVPPTTALIAWPLFGERLGLVELAGMALAALGVALVNLPRGAASVSKVPRQRIRQRRRPGSTGHG